MGLKETINAAFFGQSADNRSAELTRKIEDARSTLRMLLIEKQRLECSRSEFITDRDVAGLRTLMKEASLDISEPQRGISRLTAAIRNVSIRFHSMHGRYDIGNDDVLYVTRPLYSFEASYMSNGTARLRNITTDINTDTTLSSAWGNTYYSHPHVSDTHEGIGDFRNICFGSNHFTEVLRKSPMTPQDYIEFLRRWHIWATHGILNDMYDRDAYRDPLLTEKAKEILKNSTQLFLTAQRWMRGDIQSNAFLAETVAAGFPEQHCGVAFIRCYAAWMLNNMPKLASAVGHTFPRSSLAAAARLDLVAAYEPLDSEGNRVDSILEEVSGSVGALKKLIETSDTSDRPDRRAKADLLNQLI